MKSISYVVCKHLYFVQPFLGKHVPRNEGLSFLLFVHHDIKTPPFFSINGTIE